MTKSTRVMKQRRSSETTQHAVYFVETCTAYVE